MAAEDIDHLCSVNRQHINMINIVPPVPTSATTEPCICSSNSGLSLHFKQP